MLTGIFDGDSLFRAFNEGKRVTQKRVVCVGDWTSTLHLIDNFVYSLDHF